MLVNIPDLSSVKYLAKKINFSPLGLKEQCPRNKLFSLILSIFKKDATSFIEIINSFILVSKSTNQIPSDLVSGKSFILFKVA